MPERLGKRSMRVVGARQVLRMLRDNALAEVFLALDAAPQALEAALAASFLVSADNAHAAHPAHPGISGH